MRLLAALAITTVLLINVGCAQKKAPAQPLTSNTLTDPTPLTASPIAYKPDPVVSTNPYMPVASANNEVAISTTPTAPASTVSGNPHVVKKGETLYGLARQRYGDGKQWQKIAMANPGLSPNTLKVGQTIVIP